jgi:hypothetical protein
MLPPDAHQSEPREIPYSIKTNDEGEETLAISIGVLWPLGGPHVEKPPPPICSTIS